MPDLEVTDLEKTFPSAAGTLEILRGANLSLSRGQAAAITGPSGIGKSTLLYIIGLLEPPTSGTLRILNETPWELKNAKQAAFRNAHIGFVFQDHHLLPQCSVLENVLLPLLAAGSVTSEDETRARGLLERVALSDRADHRPAQLSGGERQRAALCRALINQPELILADEPTGNLDTHTATEVGDLLLELARDTEAMLICVTHSLELAGRFQNRYELREGKLESVDGK